MLWGVLALFVLLTFKSIIGLVATELEINNGGIVPVIPIGNSFPPANPTIGCPPGQVKDPITGACT